MLFWMKSMTRHQLHPQRCRRVQVTETLIHMISRAKWFIISHSESRQAATLWLVNSPAHQWLKDPGYFHLSTLISKIFWIILIDYSPDGPKKTALILGTRHRLQAQRLPLRISCLGPLVKTAPHTQA